MKVADPDCGFCMGTGVVDSGGSTPWGEWIDAPCGCLKDINEAGEQKHMRFIDADPLYQNGGKFEVAYEPSGLVTCKTIEVPVTPVTHKTTSYTSFIMSLPDSIPTATLKINPASNLAKNPVKKA
jgi:hypothetical protein